MPTSKTITLTNFELHQLLDDEQIKIMDKLVQTNTFCMSCRDLCKSGVTIQETILNEDNFIIVSGTCNVCGGPVNRAIEWGGYPDFAETAKQVRAQRK